MSFRFRKPHVRFALPSVITEVVEHHEFVDGVERVHFVEQSTSVISDAMPMSDDYKLSSLLAAGVPLNVVPADLLSDAPTASQLETFSSQLENDNKTD